MLNCFATPTRSGATSRSTKTTRSRAPNPATGNQAFPSETPSGLIGLLFHAASELALEKSPPWVARLAYEAATSLRSSVEIVAVLDRQTKRERHYDWLLAGPPGLVARRRTDTLIPGTYVVRCRWCGEEFYSNRPHTLYHPNKGLGCRAGRQLRSI